MLGENSFALIDNKPIRLEEYHCGTVTLEYAMRQLAVFRYKTIISSSRNTDRRALASHMAEFDD